MPFSKYEIFSVELDVGCADCGVILAQKSRCAPPVDVDVETVEVKGEVPITTST